MINPSNINQLENTMSFDDGTQAAEMFKNITINVRKELFSQYDAEAFYKKFKGIGQSFTEGREEYVAVSANAVDMLSTKREAHTFVLPTSIKHVKISYKYGTFAREFDVDLNIYSKEKNTAKIGAFVAKLGEVKTGDGDYGHSTYHIRMSSVDVNGVGNGNFGYVPAYTGVLLKALDSETTPSDFYYAIGEDDAQDYKITNNIMHGITVNPRNVSVAAIDEVIYVMQGGIFKKAMSNSISLPIHKAYAKIEGVPAGSKVEFSFSDDNTTNAIVTIDAEEKNADNAYYNLNGQRVTNPQRGVFIKGGRKVIIK